MNPLGSFSSESLLEQGKSMVRKTGNIAVQGMKVTAQTAAAQMTGNFGMISDVAANIAHADSSASTPQQPVDQDEFVKELYGAEHNQQTQPNPTQQAASVASQAPQQSPVINEEQHKLASTRQQLDVLIKQQHMDSYFNPTFNRAGKPEEESVTDKNEREDQEKKFEDFEKQKKKPDFALQRAKTRTEMSPGASG